MSDATVARVIGSLFGIAGVAVLWASMANDWGLFIPFAVALIVISFAFQMTAWSLRRANSGPGSARHPAR